MNMSHNLSLECRWQAGCADKGGEFVRLIKLYYTGLYK